MAVNTPVALASAEVGGAVTLRSLAASVKIAAPVADALWLHLDLDPDDSMCVEAASEIPKEFIDDSLNEFSKAQELSVGAVGKIALLMKRIYASFEAPAVEPQPWVDPSPAEPAEPPQETMPLRLVIDQYAHGDFPILDLATRTKFKQWHVDITGGAPPNGKQPSALQMGALNHRISKGFSPYVDFAVFAPFGNRQMKFHRFDAQIWVDNKIASAKIQGPSDYTSWKSA